MRLPASLLTLAVLAVEWATISSAQRTGNANKNNDDVVNYLGKLVPVVTDTILHKVGGSAIGADVNHHPFSARPRTYYLICFCFRQPGVVLAIIPEAQYTSWATYWVRDASLVYHIWLNKLIVSGGDKTGEVRAFVDDAVHALIRTQHTTNLAGNVLTGGLAEAVYDPHIRRLLDASSRSGSPVAGALSSVPDLYLVHSTAQIRRPFALLCF